MADCSHGWLADEMIVAGQSVGGMKFISFKLKKV